MSQTPDYSIGHPIVSKYEKQLIASLVQLYPDEGERLIVETILIPHFRAKLQEVFDDFLEARAKGPGRRQREVPLSSHETPELCSRIDKMIKKNRKLLATKTLFKPALERIQEYRSMAKEELNEASRQSFVNALAVHGITDRLTLLKKGPSRFRSKDIKFPPYGGGQAFIGTILGKRNCTTCIEELEEVADVLGFEKPTEQDVRRKQLELLADFGIIDRLTLLKKGTKWFQNRAQFPPYGGGRAFIGAILGRTIHKVTLGGLDEVADVLGFEKFTEQDEKQKRLELLAGYGITDYQSLIQKSTRWFNSKEIKFPPYGGGYAFIGSILGRRIGKVTHEILEELADALGFEKPAEQDERQKHLELLAGYGITDRLTLLKKGSGWFRSKEAKFPPYGGGCAFIGAILGRKNCKPGLEELEEVADVLGFDKYTEQDVRQKQLELLASHGITDRQSLFKKGVDWYVSKDTQFPPYGGGRAFMGAIMGRGIPRVTLEVLEELADALGFEKPTEQDERQKQLELLASYGITDRQSMLKKGTHWFKSTEARFPPYGGGYSFIGRIIARDIHNRITIAILEEAADALGFEKPSEQDERQKQLALLAGHGITDRRSLLKRGTWWFRSKDAKFPPYGGGYAFIGRIIGRSTDQRITPEMLEEVADVLFGEQERREFFDSSVLAQGRGQLVSELTKLYPDESERAVIESIILPQLFLNLEAVFTETAKRNPGKLGNSVSIRQISELCEAIDEMIRKNASLLGTRDIGKPLLDRLQMLRAEARRQLEANIQKS